MVMVMHILYVEAHIPSGVAYWAHLGGALAGALLIIAMKQPHVRLFDCVRTKLNPNEIL